MAQITQATKRLLKLNKRIRAVCGGTSASKTYSILMILIDWAGSNYNKRIDVISESYPHLEDGAIKDFKEIMVDRNYWVDNNWNESKHFYKFETGSIIKFKSVDKLGKAKGPRRDVLFINEANHIPHNIYDQLEPRTKEIIWLDWNPSNEFWYYEYIKDKVDHDFITLTYKDCLNALDQRIIDSIESRKGNKNWWKVYGLGQLGEVESKIYKDWEIIDEIPQQARLERYGLDFGYSNDPASIVAVYYYNGGYILDEITYQRGLFNSDLVGIIKNLPKALVVADSAEPKSIAEMKEYGVNIIGAKKQKEKYGDRRTYLKWSIAMVQDQQISVTKSSLNLIREYRNYLWKTDADDRILNEPEGGLDHALDAVRYAITSLTQIIRKQEYIDNLPRFVRTKEKITNPAR